ncbi:MAG TPA: response regulator [Pyrinomonadaceae bacterium]
MAAVSGDGRRCHIMVADDYDIIRQLCRAWLELRGHTVVEAENGEEAVEIARRECPDLILMDMSMPLLNGFAATRRIREIKELCGVWIVGISGIGKDHRAAALEAGCDEYVTKPFDFPQLEKLLGQLLSRPPRTAD